MFRIFPFVMDVCLLNGLFPFFLAYVFLLFLISVSVCTQSLFTIISFLSFHCISFMFCCVNFVFSFLFTVCYFLYLCCTPSLFICILCVHKCTDIRSYRYAVIPTLAWHYAVLLSRCDFVQTKRCWMSVHNCSETSGRSPTACWAKSFVGLAFMAALCWYVKPQRGLMYRWGTVSDYPFCGTNYIPVFGDRRVWLVPNWHTYKALWPVERAKRPEKRSTHAFTRTHTHTPVSGRNGKQAPCRFAWQ